MSNDKTAEEILVQHSPNPKGGYRGSWIINAMHEYSAQQLKEYKDVIRELLPLAEQMIGVLGVYAKEHYKLLPDRARKLIDQTDTK